MTNLLCSILVTMVTNTVEVRPKIMQSPYTLSIPTAAGATISTTDFTHSINTVHTEFAVEWIDDPNATVKTNVTTCKEITRLRFDWFGPKEIVSERIVWETNQVFRLEWVPKP